ncbi:MAG: 3-deoxy-manno-octulosonate cytidylyltransferase [Bacteroidales bacterium]|jgi:3-deoxy-manno-octulosonate cytidylyltransferase (CMP-KDO synthetase)
MKILGVIPARYGSSRFPGKPLANIMGKPMIQRVYERAQKCLLLDEIIVATDDERIFDCVRSFQGAVEMTSDALNSGTERCNDVIKKISGENLFDVVINIQGDEPFIDPQQISQLAGCFLSEDVLIGTLVKKITQSEDLINPNVVKVVFDRYYKALYFSRYPLPYLRGEEPAAWLTKADYFKHIGIYGYRTGILDKITRLSVSKLEKAESLEQLRWLENGFPVFIKETDYESISIDTPGDLLKITNIT